MPSHDSEVLQAKMEGNTWMHYISVAKKKSSMTALYLIAAFVVQHFFDWMWALIPLALAVFSGVECFNAAKVGLKLLKLEKGEQ
jgi:hypothetical protein